MNEPIRWLTALEDAPAGASKLLAAYSASQMPAEVHGRLLAKATQLSALKPAGVAALLASKPAVVALAIGVAGATGALATAPPAVSSRSAPAWLGKGVEAVEKLAEQRSDALRPLPQAAERVVTIDGLAHEKARVPEPKSKLAPKRARSLADEAELIDDARRLLEWDAAGALNKCREHERRFPTGQLRSTREALAMRALRKLGRGVEARQQAESLLGRDPSTLHAEEAERATHDAE